MANMFSGNIEKEIPKNINDCIKPDAVSTNLWWWCEKLETWGKIILWIIIIIGIIDTIIAGRDAQETINTFKKAFGAESYEEIQRMAAYQGVEIPSLSEVLLHNLFTWTIYAIIESITYHVIALLIGSLASIVQNTKINANIALYTSVKNGETVTEGPTQNPPFLNNYQAPAYNGSPANNIPKTIRCNQCNYEQPSDRTVCFKCGAPFRNHYWRCTNCNNVISQDPCPHCNFSTKNNSIISKQIKENTWVCPECCRENPQSATNCQCGYLYIAPQPEQPKKREEITKNLFKDSSANENLIICEECGTENPRGQKMCRNCRKKL